MSDKLKGNLKEYAKVLLVSLVVAIASTFAAQLVRVDGSSMNPTLENKDKVAVNKLVYKVSNPKRGDIIVFKSDVSNGEGTGGIYLIKRIIALPGEHILIKDNKVYINDEVLTENYISNSLTDGEVDIIVPEDNLFVMGDNREVSFDSRVNWLGTIALDDVIGRASIRLFPFSKLGKIK